MDEVKLRFKRIYAGYYYVIRLYDGAHIASIESGESAGLADRREWLVTFNQLSFYGGWDGWDSDVAQTYREGKEWAQRYAQDLEAGETGWQRDAAAEKARRERVRRLEAERGAYYAFEE